MEHSHGLGCILRQLEFNEGEPALHDNIDHLEGSLAAEKVVKFILASDSGIPSHKDLSEGPVFARLSTAASAPAGRHRAAAPTAASPILRLVSIVTGVAPARGARHATL